MTRIFLGCTPRTGNVWLRRMLAASSGCVETCAHSPDEIAWSDLPPDSVVAMHWHYTPEFAAFLRSHAFIPLVTVRHPLDVLISVLHFSRYEPLTARWLSGENGDESRLANADPTGSEFLEYALSDRAAALLAVSVEWLNHAVAVVRYEDLVAQPASVLHRVLGNIGCDPRAPLEDVVSANTLVRLKRLSRHHFWRGEPGLWRKVMTPDFRQAIARRHAGVFEALGYGCDAAAAPTQRDALRTWNEICCSNGLAVR